MEVSTKLLNPANAVTQAKIDIQSITKKVEELAKKAAKQVKIDGFRPGKVPVNVVLKRYGKDLESDAKQEIFKNILDEALKEVDKKQEDLLGEPVFSKFDEKDGFIDAEIEISFRPQISVEGYEELIPAYSTPKVMKKEIEAKISEFLMMIAPLEKVEKDDLQKGDFAKFDFEGFVDGVAFEGGKAEDYMLEVGSNQFIPGFEDGMIGMKVGEQRDVKVVFPAEYQAKHLAGKEAIFKVTLHEIQGKNPASELDEESLKKLMPDEEEVSKEKFEARVKEQIRSDKFNQLLNDELKPKFADALVEKFSFDLPKTIVEQEIDMRFRNEWQNFTPEQMKEFREDKDALEKRREAHRQEAEKSVKATFLIDELAKTRGVEVTDQEMIQAIYFEAYRYGADPKKHLDEYKNNGMLPAIKMAMIEEKLFNDLFAKKDSKKEESEGE